MTVYFRSYKWQMSNGAAICDMEQNECSKMMCKCDKTFLETIKVLTFETGCPKKDPGCPRGPESASIEILPFRPDFINPFDFK